MGIRRGGGQYQQISLFPSMEEQIGNIAVDHADEALTVSMENLISDEMVNYALVSGGGERDSRARIFAKYQKGLDHETMFRLIYRLEDIRRSVSELKREGISYPVAERLEIPQETFITQDEIDYKLSRPI